MARRRYFHRDEALTLVEKSRRWRLDAIEQMRSAPIGGPYYQALGGVLDAIDGLAEAVTGDRKLFHLKAPTTHGHRVATRRDEGEG
ncbi:hypothetical protein [Methylobacterium symbioticum]|uniref:Uncharacterized protein n=1 Tax=Methylobacterium symbioticum TaxID=2584084 RepID=A0A509EA48_9HYPH|nr:hypothetical protein [Methylobacterium symbioticum]VUD70023.1 hypothetical protein MET9862_00584 [Methylobacterium symbioticum]